ncbi:hypothetical protein FS749_015672 [Ceratobasidium sp. UAMH 11750]|nr:hypothetical protein FS749_015672 [Ceratobasidium sp. UAMH 11750]
MLANPATPTIDPLPSQRPCMPTHTGLQYPGESNLEFSLVPMMYEQDPFAYGLFQGNSEDQHIYPPVRGPKFFVPQGAPPVGLNPLAGHPRSESPRSYEPGQAFGLPGGDDGHWLPEGVPRWNGLIWRVHYLRSTINFV